MKQKGFLLAAGVSLAMAFTFSCSGDDGSDGSQGLQGLQGEQGAQGAQGMQGNDGEGCSMKSITDGIEITCGSQVDTLKNGSNGTNGIGATGADGEGCEAEQDDDGVITIICGESKVGIAFCGEENKLYNPISQSCYNDKVYYSFTDSRDNTKYVYVKIGDQTWMAENLNYETESGSACYGDDDSNCTTYGRLYDWSTADTACPIGWHLPTNGDWDKLLRYVDGNTETSGLYESSTAGRYLKSASGWNNDGNGEDAYGFAALPGGYGSSDGGFDIVGKYGLWWSASEYDDSYAYRRDMEYDSESVYTYDSNKSLLFSVRCLQD